MDWKPGVRIDGFEILGPLGAGGMGVVYRALDTRLGREVALKTLPVSVSQDADRRARFDREARLLASLNHPGIGAIYGIEETPQGPLLILELVAGNTLAEVIARGPMPLGEALSIARQIAEAVAAAHAAGVVHRDLKPANVKWTPDGKVKVLDFGIAKAVSAGPSVGGSDITTVRVGLTVEGAIVGTPSYMSPEQARAESVDRRSDIWSLGCMLYEMLTGVRAFQGRTATDTFAAILERDPDWTAIPPGTPSAVRTLLRRCLQRDRDRRLHDMSDVRIEIEDALGSPSAHEGGTPALRVGIRGIEVGAACVIATCLLVNALILPQIGMLVRVFASHSMVLSLPLRRYIIASNLAVKPPVVVLTLLAAWLLLRGGRRAVPPAVRTAALVTVAAVVCAVTVAGLYAFARDGLMQAVRTNMIAGAPASVLRRDIGWLYLATGQSARAIALLDPSGNRDDFTNPVRFESPGEAFLLAESYRAAQNFPAARRLYQRAQEAATIFDEALTERLLASQVQLQNEFGQDFKTWLPATADLRRLPDLIRTVSQQRLDQMASQTR